MAKIQNVNEALLQDILSQPTAPYREQHVARLIERLFTNAGVPYFFDPVGNIVVGVKSKKEYLSLIGKKSPEPVRMFIAHMDHPGFHGTNWLPDGTLEITWHGGSPVKYFEGYKVWLGSERGWEGSGEIVSGTLRKSGLTLEKAIVRVTGFEPGAAVDLAEFKKRYKKASALFGGFRFRAPVWKDNSLIYTKAADDLVGVFSIVSTALTLFGKKKKQKAPFLGVITRAEEVGWIGAIGHLDLGWLKSRKREVIAVSLETSRTLPGAEIGKGPVVRRGDKFTVFSPAHTRVLLDIAEKQIKGSYQSRIMDGGSCEASAATIFGLPAVGISIPLGNYHNTAFEGGPDCGGPEGPAPEFVHMGDISGMLALCQGLMASKLPWVNPWGKKLEALQKNYKKAKSFLK